MSKPILFRKDIIKKYAAKRKALTEADVKDLLRCAINFMAKDIEKHREYAYEIPHIGFMYRKLQDTSYRDANSYPPLMINMMRELIHSPAKKPLVLRNNFLREINRPMTLEELEPIQNEIADAT